MASPERITEVLPQTLPANFVEWDEASPSAQPVRSGSGESVRRVSVLPKATAQAANAHRTKAESGHFLRASALSVSAFENAEHGVVPDPALPLSRAWFSSRNIIVLIVLAVAMIPVFISGPDIFDGYGFVLGRSPSAKPAAALAPTIPQPEGATPTRAPSTMTVPPSTATATTAGQVQATSEAAPRPAQTNARPTREQAQMMNDQLNTPTRIQMKGTSAEPAPLPSDGLVAADIDGLDNSKAIGAVFDRPKQSTDQIAYQQVLSVSVPSSVALALLIHKTPPVYPLIAKVGQISGTIVLAANISKTGIVENLRVLSGPVMLRMAAVNAVRTWRFKPYLLNDQPTAIETTVNVHFCGPADPCTSDGRE